MLRKFDFKVAACEPRVYLPSRGVGQIVLVICLDSKNVTRFQIIQLLIYNVNTLFTGSIALARDAGSPIWILYDHVKDVP